MTAHPRNTLAVFAILVAGCTLGRDPDDISLVGNNDEPTHTIEDATIEITSPVGSVYATDSIDIIVATTANPERIELTKDGEPFAVFAPGTTRYTWHVESEEEKAYQIRAVAIAPDGEIQSPPVEIIVDNTPPRVETRSPEAGAENVDLRDPIWMEFSEPLDPETVGADTIELVIKGRNLVIIQLPDEDLPVDLELSDDRKRVDVVPTNRVTGPAPLRLTLSGVSDDAGNEISEKSWEWRAAGWAPAAVPISGLLKPSLELDGEQPWLHGQGGDGTFKVLREAEGEWVEVATYDPAAPAPVNPREFVLTPGTSHAWALLETPEEYEIVRYNLAEGTAELVDTRPLDTRPGLAIDTTGDVFFAHDRAGEGALTIERWADDAWQEVISVEPTGDPTDCNLSAGERLVLVATNQISGEATFWELDKTDWSVVDLRINPLNRPAMKAAGEATGTHAALVEQAPEGASLQVRRYNEQGTWPANLDAGQDHQNLNTASEIRQTALEVEGNGTVWLAWEEHDLSRPSPVSRVHVRRWREDNWFPHSGALGLSPDDPTWTTHPDLELRGVRDPLVAYAIEEETRVVQLNVYDP